MGVLCDIIGGNMFADSSTEEFITKRNEVLSELNRMYNEGDKEAIENVVVEYMLDQVEDKKDKTKYDKVIQDSNLNLSLLSSAFGLDINTFNYYYNDYFSISTKEGMSKQMPLYQQEMAIFQHASLLAGSSSDIYEKIYNKFFKVAVNNLPENYKKYAERNKPYVGVSKLVAAAGTGKTKMVAAASVKIAEQIKGYSSKKTIVTAPVTNMASDIYSEMNAVEVNLKQTGPLSLSDIFEKLEKEPSFFDGVDTFVIDEATLIDAEPIYKGEPNSFEVLYKRLKEKGIKMIILGDTKQLSYNEDLKIGRSYIPEGGTNNPLMKSTMGIMESQELTDSFRTTSKLIIDPTNELRNGHGILGQDNPLEIKHSYSATDEKQLMGIDITNGSSIDSKDITKRVSDFANALDKKTTPGYTLMESIEHMVKTKKGKERFSLLYATDAGFSMAAFMTELENHEVGKKFVKFIKDNEGKFLFFSEKVSDPQGSEADYVIAEFNNTSVPSVDMNANKSGGVGFVSSEQSIANQIVYTLLSRTKSFVHIINNAPNLFFNNVRETKAYDILSNDAILGSAEKARMTYQAVYESTSNLMHDTEGAQGVINWREPIIRPWLKPEITVTKAKPETQADGKDISIIKNIADASDKSIDAITEEIAILMDKIADDNTPIDEASKLLDQVNRLSSILNAKGILANRETVAYTETDYSQVLKAILNSDEYKRLAQKDRAVFIAAQMSKNGYPIAYNNIETIKGDTPIDIEDKEKALLINIGVNKSNINTDPIEKKQAMGLLDKKDNTFNYSIRIKRELDETNKYIYKFYVTARNTATGKEMLVLTAPSHLWQNEQFSDMIDSINSLNGFDNNDVYVSTQNIPYNNIVDHLSPGRIRKVSENPDSDKKPIKLSEFFKDGGLFDELKSQGVFISKQIYTYTGLNSKNFRLSGKQFLIYSQSDMIDVDNASFHAWVEKAIDDEGSNGQFTGMYQEGDIKHKVGMLMLDNRGYDFNEIYEFLESKEHNDKKDIYNLLLNYYNMRNVTAFFSAILSKGIEKNVSNKSPLAKVIEDNDTHSLFTNPEDKTKFDKRIEAVFNNDEEFTYNSSGKTITTTKGEVFKQFMHQLFSVKNGKSELNLGKFRLNEDGSLAFNEKNNHLYPKYHRGNFFTIITDKIKYSDKNGKEVETFPIYRLDLKAILTSLRTFADSMDISKNAEIASIITNSLTSLYTATSYGSSEGIKTGINFALPGTTRVENRVYAKTNGKEHNNLNIFDDELLVNFESIDPASAVMSIENMVNIINNELYVLANQKANESNKLNDDSDKHDKQTDIKEDEGINQEPDLEENQVELNPEEHVILNDLEELIDEDEVEDEEAYNEIVKNLNTLSEKKYLSIDKKVNIIYDIYNNIKIALGEGTDSDNNVKEEIRSKLENPSYNIDNEDVKNLFKEFNCN